jgi:hypothetical protein
MRAKDEHINGFKRSWRFHEFVEAGRSAYRVNPHTASSFSGAP